MISGRFRSHPGWREHTSACSLTGGLRHLRTGRYGDVSVFHLCFFPQALVASWHPVTNCIAVGITEPIDEFANGIVFLLRMLLLLGNVWW